MTLTANVRARSTAAQGDAALAAAAREHAARMAQRNVLSHQLPGEPQIQDRATQAGARFTTIAENIAVAPNRQPFIQHGCNRPSSRKHS